MKCAVRLNKILSPYNRKTEVLMSVTELLSSNLHHKTLWMGSANVLPFDCGEGLNL